MSKPCFLGLPLGLWSLVANDNKSEVVLKQLNLVRFPNFVDVFVDCERIQSSGIFKSAPFYKFSLGQLGSASWQGHVKVYQSPPWLSHFQDLLVGLMASTLGTTPVELLSQTSREVNCQRPGILPFPTMPGSGISRSPHPEWSGAPPAHPSRT